MIRTFFIDFLLPIVLFLLLRSFLQNFFVGLRRDRPTGGGVEPGSHELPSAGDLKRDPVCGTYVSTAVSVKRTVNGQVVHFCSKECRDKYKA